MMDPVIVSLFGPAAFSALLIVIGLLALWEGVWKAIALWKSARNDQLAWFICIAIFNTAGILPIVYILFFQRQRMKRK